MKEKTVTISLKEYEELKYLKDNHLTECYKLANTIHQNWLKDDIYWAAVKNKQSELKVDYEQFLQKEILDWKNKYFSLKKKVEENNKKFFPGKINL